MTDKHIADKFALVEVTWVDASSMSGWLRANEFEKFARDPLVSCRSVGYLPPKLQSKSKVVLAASIGANDTWSSVTEIPRPNVKRIRRLRR